MTSFCITFKRTNKFLFSTFVLENVQIYDRKLMKILNAEHLKKTLFLAFNVKQCTCKQAYCLKCPLLSYML